jgi:2-dehydropantoate 2-reductase
MRVAVIGAGGIGGVIAAGLTRAGMDVTPVVGNAAVERSLNEHGYRVRELEGDEWSVPLSRPATLALRADGEPFDLALLCTQSTTMEAALAAALPHLGSSAPVVACQNGLPEERAQVLAGRDRVLGCVVGWGASMIAPGVFQRTSRGGLQLGRPSPSAPDPLPIAALLEAVSPAHVVGDLAGVRWSKLAINCVTTTVGAVGGAPLGRLLMHRTIRRVALEIFAEVAEVAQALGVRMQPVGGTLDIEKIAITDAERETALGSPSLAFKHSLLFAVGMKYRRLRSSMLYALERGRPPEIDYLNGEVVRRAAQLGVPTPVNDALCDRVRAIARKQAAPSIAALKRLHDEVVLGRAQRTAA